jgi:cell division protein FtsW (lipid II flippase)
LAASALWFVAATDRLVSVGDNEHQKEKKTVRFYRAAAGSIHVRASVIIGVSIHLSPVTRLQVPF